MTDQFEPVPAAWRLPDGVDPALWQYAHAQRLADTEDHYFEHHPLFETDSRVLRERFVEPGPLIDLGCGAGRLSVAFAAGDFDVASVDLSQPMLLRARQKAIGHRAVIHPVRANLCRLDCFPSNTFSYALAMFSTFGMIRTASARRRAMAEAFRVLAPGGRLALHAHNIWLNLFDSQGRSWLWKQIWLAARRRSNLGDRCMTYRGIPGMSVHLYRWRELRRDLKDAGFRIEEVVALDAVTAKPIRWAWFFPSTRAGGWIVFARKP